VVNDVPVPREVPPVATAYQLIVPAEAVAPRVTVPAPHLAAGVVPVMVGILRNVTVISDVDDVQAPLSIHHRKTYVFPEMPENVEVGLDALPSEPPKPLITIHVPTPTIGVLAARVVEVIPHATVWSSPALLVVGVFRNVTITLSVEGVHGELLIVQRNV
jgi:hypothetical protein